MQNRVIIGTDEAGYGPNLGPLVVTATSWQVPADLECEQMWDLLSVVLTNSPQRNDPRLHIADSKQVYSPVNGLLDLETGVLSFLGTLDMAPATTRELGRCLAGQIFDTNSQQDPTLSHGNAALPLAAFPDEINEFRNSILNAFEQTGVRLLGIRSRIMFPPEFNHLVDKTGSKGIILSHCTLQLIRSLCPAEFRDANSTGPASAASRSLFSIDPCVETDSPSDTDAVSCQAASNVGSVHVFCDKHGGRNRYDAVISEHFDDQFVFRREESTAVSRYRMGKVEFCFRTKAEELLPVALASMVSKYVRESLMEDFNAFWQYHLPDLKPTKGYPLDARRFRQAIQETATRLGIRDTEYWRQK